MKVNSLHGALALSLLMFSACSSDDADIIAPDSANSTQELVLQVSSVNDDAIASRAGRPLYSSEAAQSIENVTVIIVDVDDDIVAYTTTITDWMNNNVSSSYSGGAHGRKKTITIPESSKLVEGTYKVYAFGYHGSENVTSDYNLTPITNVKKGDTFKGNPVIKLNNSSTAVAEEIFAGANDLTVKNDIGFNKSIVLNRQVAGVFGYFEAIPYVEGATKLRLVASQRNSSVVLGGFYNQILNANGTAGNLGENPENAIYTVNGTDKVTEDKSVIYEIDLTKWFGSTLVNNDGIVGGNWKSPYAENEAKFKPGSVFAGTFVIPFLSVTDTYTFTLELMKDGKAVKSWVVKTHDGTTDGSDNHPHNYFLQSWDGSKFTTSGNKTANSERIYHVVRNHLYGIGQRVGNTPENPGTGTDTPESLNKKEELTLRVNDNWEIIHKMDIEELDTNN